MSRSIRTMIFSTRLMMIQICNITRGFAKQTLLLYYFFTTGNNNLVAAPS